MREPSLDRGIEAVLSPISRDVSRSPLSLLGSTGGRRRRGGTGAPVTVLTLLTLIIHRGGWRRCGMTDRVSADRAVVFNRMAAFNPLARVGSGDSEIF